MVADMTDERDLGAQPRRPRPRKVYAAYKAAAEHHGQPTVILAKTIKGYGMGEAGEGQNITHQQKKMNEAALLAFRDRFELELTDEQVKDISFYKPPEDSRGGGVHPRAPRGARRLPARRAARKAAVAADAGADRVPEPARRHRGPRDLDDDGFVRILVDVLRDKQLGKHVVPIVPDESRTFGMEGMFRQLGIFSQVGQLYTPEDREQLMFYREDKHGQMLQEGINEAGAMSSWIAAGTSYSNHGVADDPVLHLLLDVRLPAGRRSRLGRGRQPHARLPARRHRRAGRRSTARACSTRTATRTCRARRSRTASPTTRPTGTSWR